MPRVATKSASPELTRWLRVSAFAHVLIACDAVLRPLTRAFAGLVNGQPGKLSTNDRCKKDKYRRLCCDDGTRMGTCQWRGYRGVGLTCMGGCGDGETEVVQNTNSHDKKAGDRTCTGGIQSYCCKGFKPAPTTGKLKDKAEDAAKDAAEAAAEQAALDIAAKAFCRLAVPALLAPLELIEAAIPIIGEQVTVLRRLGPMAKLTLTTMCCQARLPILPRSPPLQR